eukprot:CAMPEP_0181323942 /NCGR_PEP_ID=MMETSP1101-20121128/20073_1 /TAXON_ID=46948 /ORGANISM="Rhodomonas abbreviata, Strain Caron Lab Isolate" /LENGTH=257 /DNA_ID=CAMNT_0023432041 /DNA_START=158 /DNA_END=931 /DNA_ORIENTATION=+
MSSVEADAGIKLSFTQEMRNKAMSLHTFSQAPKEGKVKDQNVNTVVQEWQTTGEDFIQFLVDSRAVYEALESAVTKGEFQIFQNTGLERVEALDKDIVFLQDKYKLSVPKPTAQAVEYASFLLDLAEKQSPAFVCHFYNFYFAHTAGGRMIGKKVMDETFGGYLFEFYQWEGDVKETLTEVKGRIDTLAKGWTREQKDSALDATPQTFQKSGALLRVLVGKARERAVAMVNKVQVKGGKITKVPEAAYSQNKAAWDL